MNLPTFQRKPMMTCDITDLLDRAVNHDSADAWKRLEFLNELRKAAIIDLSTHSVLEELANVRVKYTIPSGFAVFRHEGNK